MPGSNRGLWYSFDHGGNTHLYPDFSHKNTHTNYISWPSTVKTNSEFQLERRGRSIKKHRFSLFFFLIEISLFILQVLRIVKVSLTKSIWKKRSDWNGVLSTQSCKLLKFRFQFIEITCLSNEDVFSDWKSEIVLVFLFHKFTVLTKTSLFIWNYLEFLNWVVIMKWTVSWWVLNILSNRELNSTNGLKMT